MTATRRSVALKDTPVAVAVKSGDELVRNNVTSFQDLTRIEPSLVVNNQGAAGNQFIIRGILSDIGATTGFYVDEAALIGGGSIPSAGDGKPGLRLHDIARIEVLKGPQGTLFGSGSLAGTLRIVTNQPKTDVVEGEVNISGASVKSGNWVTQNDATINLPISDKIAVRAVGWGEFGGGYIDQHAGLAHTTLLPNVNDRNVYGGRVEVLVKPTDDLKIIGSATYQKIEVDGIQAATRGRGPYFGTYDSNTESQEPYRDAYQLYSVTAEYAAPFGTFTAIGTYGRQNIRRPADTTPLALLFSSIANGIFCAGPGVPGAVCPVPPRPVDFAVTQGFNDQTAEARFASRFAGPFQIVLGGYYERDHLVNNNSAEATDVLTGAVPCLSLAECAAAGLRTNTLYAQTFRRVVNQWAIYGQADYSILDNLTATVGARYYRARIVNKIDNLQNLLTGFAGIVDTPVFGTRDRGSESSPSYNFSLLYKATPDVSVYARAASGFRIGGINNAAGIAGQTGVAIPLTYKPDKLWSYELGAKAYLFGRKLYTELTVYQMDWRDLQNSATTSSGFTYTINAGKARIRGVELTATYRDGPFSIGGGGTFTHAVLARDLPAEVAASGVVGFKGDRIPRTPRWNLSGQTAYEVPLTATVTGYAQGNVNYRGSSRYSFNGQNMYYSKLPSYVLVGAAVGIRVDKVDASLFVENLTNEDAVFGFDQTLGDQKAYLVPPRTIGARVHLQF